MQKYGTMTLSSLQGGEGLKRNEARQIVEIGMQGTNNGSEGSTRDKILLLLRTKRRLTAAQLAEELELTGMAIRRHMYSLEREGCVNIVSIRQAMGRPLHMYELTKQADELFPKNYETLTLDLLHELEEDPHTAALIDRMFEGRKQKLIDRYAPRMEGKSLTERLTQLEAIQNAGGYMAQLEQKDDGAYMLYEYNCPIAGVAGKYGQACNCELALFQQLLEAPVERTECLAKGEGRCSYRIG